MKRLAFCVAVVCLSYHTSGAFGADSPATFINHWGKAGSDLKVHVDVGAVFNPSCDAYNPHSCQIALDSHNHTAKLTYLAWGELGPEIKTLCQRSIHGGERLTAEGDGACSVE